MTDETQEGGPSEESAPAPAPALAPEPESAPGVTPETTGLWECLAEAGTCSLASPDSRTAGRPFPGPSQDQARGSATPVTCPQCGGNKVIYRGQPQAAAEAA